MTALFLLTKNPIRAPHMLYLLETESITIACSSNPSKFQDGGMGSTFIDKLPVHLIHNKEEIMLYGNVSSALRSSSLRVEVSGRISRITNKNSFGLRGLISFSNSSIGGRAKPFIREASTGTTFNTCLCGKAIVVGIEGLGNDHLVSRIHDTSKGEKVSASLPPVVINRSFMDYVISTPTFLYSIQPLLFASDANPALWLYSITLSSLSLIALRATSGVLISG